jgi:hypothetical protein
VGKNFIRLEIEISARLEEIGFKMRGEEFTASDIPDNHTMAHKAKSMLIQSLTTEKKQLAKAKSPYGILQAIRNDYTQKSGIAQINQLRKIQETEVCRRNILGRSNDSNH